MGLYQKWEAVTPPPSAKQETRGGFKQNQEEAILLQSNMAGSS